MTDFIIKFNVEHPDRAVGIMSEGFSAWFDTNQSAHNNHAVRDFHDSCYITEWSDTFEQCKFQWYSDDGDEIARPVNPLATVLERALHGFANGFYAAEALALDLGLPEEPEKF